MADLLGMGGSAWPDAGRLGAWVLMALAHNSQLFSLRPCSLSDPLRLKKEREDGLEVILGL